MTKPRNNSSEQLLRKLEKLRDDKTKVRVIHGGLHAIGVIEEILVGRYKIFIQVGKTIFPADLCAINIRGDKPSIDTVGGALEYDASKYIEELRRAGAVDE